MELVSELRRSLYAVVGAGVEIADFTRQLPDQMVQAWQHRQEGMNRLGETYNHLADRGEAALSEAQTALQRQARAPRDQARRIPAVAAAAGEITGWFAEQRELPITDYDSRTAAEIIERLPTLSQRELHQIEGYETRTKERSSVLSRVDDLRGAEPWPGYDEMAVEEILPRLRAASPSKQAEVAEHERRHKQRRTILTTAQR